MDSGLIIAIVIAALLGGVVLALLLRREEPDDTGDQLKSAIESLANSQGELAGRLSQMAESAAAQQAQLAERLGVQEKALSKTMEDRLGDLSRRVGETLQQSSTKTGETMAKLQERLAVIDAAQKNITELSSQVVGLQDILSNKQARGAFGEIQLQDIVQSALPPSAFEFQATLENGKRADCLVHMPNPPGSIVIDAKFPLESYRALIAAKDDTARTLAARRFTTDVTKHISDIAERYIVPGETAESALMFLPSEAVYAELHANFIDVVEKSHKKRVWIVSPTTLMATLNTVRAVLKDANMREQAGVIQAEIMTMLQDLGRLDDRVGKLQRHFDMAQKDLEGIKTSTDKVQRRGVRIGEMEFGEDGTAETLPADSAEIHRIGD
jgi:DNA recombination protein RmuC